MNLNLFLAAMWAVIGIALLLPNSGMEKVIPDPTVVGGFALMLSAYNIVRWRFTRVHRQLDEEAQALRPPPRPRVHDHDEPPNPDFDFGEPKSRDPKPPR